MTGYFYANGIKIFDFAKFSQPLTEKVRENAEELAKANNLEIEFIRKTQAFRKDDRIQDIIKQTGKTEGLVHIFSAMESCNTYRPWHDKATGNTFFKFDKSKCLHYYFYFIDRELGLCYIRVPTWCPFRLQFYMNGHNLLVLQRYIKKMDKLIKLWGSCAYSGINRHRITPRTSCLTVAKPFLLIRDRF